MGLDNIVHLAQKDDEPEDDELDDPKTTLEVGFDDLGRLQLGDWRFFAFVILTSLNIFG